MVWYRTTKRHRHHKRKKPAVQNLSSRIVTRVALLYLVCILALLPSSSCIQYKLLPTKYTTYMDEKVEPNVEIDLPPTNCHAPVFLKPFYAITRSIMSVIVTDRFLPPGYVTVNERQGLDLGPKVERNEWGDLIVHHWPITLILVIMTVIAIVIPIIGLYILIKECREDENEDLQDAVEEKPNVGFLIFGHLLLSILTIGILFGFLAAFVSSNYLELAEKDYSGPRLANNFFAIISRQLNRILISNYTQLSYKMHRIMYAKLEYVRDRLKQNSMEKTREFLKNYNDSQMRPAIQDLLANMLNDTKVLPVDSVQLADMLRGFRRKYNFEAINYAIGLGIKKSRYINIDIGQEGTAYLGDNGIQCLILPQIENTVTNLYRFFDTPLLTGIDGMANITTFIANSIEEQETKVNHILKLLNKAGAVLQKTSKDIQLKILKSIKQITSETVINDLQSKYDPYRFCLGLVSGSVLLLILICLIGGLLCGICGGNKNVNGSRNRCCNRGDGAFFLMAVALLIFAFITLLALSALVHFLPGIVAYRVYCNQQPSVAGNRLIDAMLVECRKNKSILVALNVTNLKEFEKYNIYDKLHQLQHSKEANVPSLSQLINENDMEKFKDLEENNALINLAQGKLVENLVHNFTPKPFPYQSYIYIPPQYESGTVTQTIILNKVKKLQDYNNKLKFIIGNIIMQEFVSILKYEYEEALKFEAKDKCLECFVNDSMEGLSKTLCNAYNRYTSMLKEFMGGNKVGSCYLLAAAYDSYYNSICCEYVDLMNGYWVAILWCLLLFLPILLVSFKLANLYHKLDPYPNPYQDVKKPVEHTAKTTITPRASISPERRSSNNFRNSIVYPSYTAVRLSRTSSVPRKDDVNEPQTRRPIESVNQPMRRSLSETRKSFKQKQTDIQRISIKQNKSRTSTSSSTSSDIELVIQRRKSKKD